MIRIRSVLSIIALIALVALPIAAAEVPADIGAMHFVTIGSFAPSPSFTISVADHAWCSAGHTALATVDATYFDAMLNGIALNQLNAIVTSPLRKPETPTVATQRTRAVKREHSKTKSNIRGFNL